MLKKDYSGGPMVISYHNRRGDVYRQISCPVVWPSTNINAMDLDYIGGGSTVFTISGFTFVADYWEDVSV